MEGASTSARRIRGQTRGSSREPIDRSQSSYRIINDDTRDDARTLASDEPCGSLNGLFHEERRSREDLSPRNIRYGVNMQDLRV